MGPGWALDSSGTSEVNYSVDLQAQYRWLKLEKANVNLVGDNVNLDAVSSHRTRVGGRLNYTANRQFTPYAGLAWEHEFTYKSSGSVYGYGLKEADGSGSSGVGEIGVSFNPDANGPFTIDANVQAYMGQREGVMGRLMANCRFQAFSPGRVAPVFLKCPREPACFRKGNEKAPMPSGSFLQVRAWVIIPGAGSDSKIVNLSLSLPGNLSVNPRMINSLY